MSDSTGLQNVEWQPLVPENPVQGLGASETPSTAGAATHPKTVEDSFQFLYEIRENTEPGMEFIPFYGRPVSGEKQGDPATADGAGEKEPSPEEIRQRAYAEGFAKGEKEGFEAGKQKAVPIVQQMQDLLQEIDGLWHRLVETYEEKIVQLVGRVSEKVVLAKVAVDHDTAKRVILDAFRLIPEPAEVTIDIHPQDAEQIETIKEAFFEQIKALKHIALLPDPSVSPGGCRIKTRFGEVDATLESRLAAVQETIMNVYRNKGESGDV